MFIQVYFGLFIHGAGGDRRPFSVLFSYTSPGHQQEIKFLILA